MKKSIAKAAFLLVALSCMVSCAPRYGCPSNGKNVGAERYFDGSKIPKARKMRV